MTAIHHASELGAILSLTGSRSKERPNARLACPLPCLRLSQKALTVVRIDNPLVRRDAGDRQQRLPACVDSNGF